MIKAIIFGCNGKMGQVLSNLLLQNSEFEVVAGIDKDVNKFNNSYKVYEHLNDFNGEVDVIIDFSHPSYLDQLLIFSLKRKVPLVIATTGLSEDDNQKIHIASTEFAILQSANMSLGINILANILKQVSAVLIDSFDIEIIEKHHNRKIDAPSGTAKLLADAINESLGNRMEYVYGRSGGNAKREPQEIGIHAIRGGTIPGEHTVIFAGNDEIIEFKHTALSKNIFALGAIKAAQFIIKKDTGLFTMNDIFNFNKEGK
jgi:4-hydroxy-tetrahydrodipicolinate reductase